MLKVLGLLTDDFEVYYELVQALKARNIPFLSLAHGDRIPPSVGVLVTTAAEAAGLEAKGVDLVVFTNPPDTIEQAAQRLAGKRWFSRVIIGIDPGEKPGIAVLGDGHVIRTLQVRVPEHAALEIERVLRTVAAESFIVRVGHGAPTYRDRILRALQEDPALDLRVEVVDETDSTPLSWGRAEERDTHAAEAIALARGVEAAEVVEIRPSEGELRDIQRKSRLASGGRVTIGRHLARQVAVGELTLDEAIIEQQMKRAAAE